jgi:hypothetical protein
MRTATVGMCSKESGMERRRMSMIRSWQNGSLAVIALQLRRIALSRRSEAVDRVRPSGYLLGAPRAPTHRTRDRSDILSDSDASSHASSFTARITTVKDYTRRHLIASREQYPFSADTEQLTLPP